jgi:ABC-type lipopolysaccharide export system ATPase subunit
MVDFNNEATIGTPAVDVVRILVLQRHSDLIEAWESYIKQRNLGIQANLSVTRARLVSMFLQIHPTIKRKLSPENYTKFFNELRGTDEATVYKNIMIINEILDEVRITRIDTKLHYDRTYVEKEDKEKGL